MKTLLTRVLAAAGFAAALQLGGAAVAKADDLAAIKQAGVIKIGTEGTYAPSPITTARTSSSASTSRSAARSPSGSA